MQCTLTKKGKKKTLKVKCLVVHVFMDFFNFFLRMKLFFHFFEHFSFIYLFSKFNFKNAQYNFFSFIYCLLKDAKSNLLKHIFIKTSFLFFFSFFYWQLPEVIKLIRDFIYLFKIKQFYKGHFLKLPDLHQSQMRYKEK